MAISNLVIRVVVACARWMRRLREEWRKLLAEYDHTHHHVLPFRLQPESAIVAIEEGPTWTEIAAFLGLEEAEKLKQRIVRARRTMDRSVLGRMNQIIDEMPLVVGGLRWFILQDEFARLMLRLDGAAKVPPPPQPAQLLVATLMDQPVPTIRRDRKPTTMVEWHWITLHTGRYGISFDIRTDASRFLVIREDDERSRVASGLVDASGVMLDDPHVPLHPELYNLLVSRWDDMRERLLDES